MAASLPSTSTSAHAEITHQPSLKGQNPLSLFSPEVRSWEREILRWSSDHELPPELVATVMQIESCGAANATSSAGAMGLFQVMPFHFSQSDNPYDPDVNAARGLEYLSRSYALAGGAIDKTLAGYNGGHSVINWDPTKWSAETNRYVRWGTGIWEEIHLSGLRSKTLEEWLNAGGEHLCRQARDDSSPR
jgi:soluble lytic murein transglycosylase-like protein